MSNNVCLSKEEIFALTKKKQPAKQLDILLERGFYRAFRVNETGEVILERAHYEAVCMGLEARSTKTTPKVRRIRHEEEAPI